MSIEWTSDDSNKAATEGWDIFECIGSDHGPFQLQKFDSPEENPDAPDPYPFAEDTDVWLHVRDKARCGSTLHQRALAFLLENNREEWLRVLAWEKK